MYAVVSSENVDEDCESGTFFFHGLFSFTFVFISAYKFARVAPTSCSNNVTGYAQVLNVVYKKCWSRKIIRYTFSQSRGSNLIRYTLFSNQRCTGADALPAPNRGHVSDCIGDINHTSVVSCTCGIVYLRSPFIYTLSPAYSSSFYRLFETGYPSCRYPLLFPPYMPGWYLDIGLVAQIAQWNGGTETKTNTGASFLSVVPFR